MGTNGVRSKPVLYSFMIDRNVEPVIKNETKKI